MNQTLSEREISDKKRTVQNQYGPWTAHNFSLGNAIFTIKDGVSGDEVKLRRVVQLVSDICDRPMIDLRVLDLACLEGMYSIELAKQGAHVCAIEGRETNLEKARFAAQVLRLGNIDFQQDDVRNLSEGKHGKFDVVLCLGILYHLDSTDVFRFLENVFAVCRRVAVIDTCISLYPEQTFFHKGKRYLGKTVLEHALGTSPAEKQKNLWASLDNPNSVHFTRRSLCSLLYDLGFTSVCECHVPQEPQKPAERVTLVAIKGTTVPPICCPQLPIAYGRDLPEELTSATTRMGLRLVSRFVPRGLKSLAKKALFSDNAN